MKALMRGFVIVMAVGFMTGQAMARDVPAQITQIMITSPYVVPLDADGRVMSNPNNPVTALVDNFEYRNNPRNMGWIPDEPPYPVWGVGLGTANLNCIPDTEQGSKVLDVYRPMLFFPMQTRYRVLTIRKDCALPNGNPIPGANSMMCLEIRAPAAPEQLDSFSVSIACKATASDGTGDCAVTIFFLPYDGPQGYVGMMNDPDVIEDGTQIVVYLGSMFQDGSWHPVSQDLAQILDAYDPGAALDSIEMVEIRGNHYRIDNIMFVKNPIAENSAVHLLHIGPVYWQLYGQLSDLDALGEWIFAEDSDLGLTCVGTKDGGYLFPHIFDVSGITPVVLEIPMEDPSAYDKG